MLNFNNTYVTLPEYFYHKVNPTKVINPSLIKFNYKLAEELGLYDSRLEDITNIFSGNIICQGSQPIAQVYAGHQFGHFVPRLGDGRAILLGEVFDSNGYRKDIQLKGSGRTPYSRGGDGRAWLGPVIREYIISEFMHNLAVPTTRSLAAVLTGEDIYRQEALPGAILTRVASSHIRIGSFEYFAAKDDTKALKLLADYVIDRHYSVIKNDTNPYLSLLEQVLKKQSLLVAKWMSIGFIHGVMNTDNMSISGETIDYGPCAFMDYYDQNMVFSSIDNYGRYAYSNQPKICQWNLSCLAEALLPIIDSNKEHAIELCTEVLNSFNQDFKSNFYRLMIEKIGLDGELLEDFMLVQGLLDLMQKYKADFTLTFRYLSKIVDENNDLSIFLKLFDEEANTSSEINLWLSKWRLRLKRLNLDSTQIEKKMNLVNPAFIPRNHKIEEMIEKAHLNNDYSLMNDFLEIMENPFQEQDLFREYFFAPENKVLDYVTFCGT
jgi:uncharacterized protein YdiU (UPF0061 family)